MNNDPKTKIVLITGPSGAGKSTVAKALAKTGKGMWAYIGQDDIRTLKLAIGMPMLPGQMKPGVSGRYRWP